VEEARTLFGFADAWGVRFGASAGKATRERLEAKRMWALRHVLEAARD